VLGGLALGAAAPAAAVSLPDPPASASAPAGRVFGRSVKGRDLTVLTLGDPTAPKRIVVVGIIHGNEQAGLKVLALLKKSTPPANTALYLIDAINPDGQHLDSRQNAHGVDLNRNFPTRWKSYGHPHDTYYPGPHAVSEPETKAMIALVTSLRPQVTIYYHQHLDVIDLSGGNEAIERAYAHRVGMKPQQLTRYGGSACTWADTVFHGSTAFCVELPSVVSPALAKRHAQAVLALAADQAATIPLPTATATP
jgi:protein MpaA